VKYSPWVIRAWSICPWWKTVTRWHLVKLWDRCLPTRIGAVEHGSWGIYTVVGSVSGQHTVKTQKTWCVPQWIVTCVIHETVIVTWSYEFQESNKSDYQSKPISSHLPRDNTFPQWKHCIKRVTIMCINLIRWMLWLSLSQRLITGMQWRK
jgi:hypothetical protein